ncbi:uncharacterized protein METZ01_LOCUS280012, partial [marine metagenome]
MRKMIAMMIVLGLSVSLYANNNASDKYGKDGAPAVRSLPDYRAPNSRTEEYELYLTDSYGDGWNGATVSVFLDYGDVAIVDGATIDDGDEASYLFDVELGMNISTVWVSGSYDSECTYGIYDAEGYLIIESGAGEITLGVTDYEGFCNVGNEEWLGSWSAHSPNYLLGFQVEVLVGGNAEYLSIIAGDNGPNQQIQMALYTDDGARDAASLVANTDAVEI